jgi:hypothetical protein
VRIFETFGTIHRLEDRWKQIRGVRGTRHWDIFKEKRRKLMKKGVAKTFWTVGSRRRC